MIRHWQMILALLLAAANAGAQGPKNIQAGRQETSGACSPAVVAGGNVTITCQNLDPALVSNLHLVLKRLNAISAGQLDAKAVARELDEIKALVARGNTVSSAAVEAGVVGGLEKYAQEQQRQFQAEQNDPQHLAQTSYTILSKYLGMLKTMTPAQPADSESQLMSTFHARFDFTIATTLQSLASRNLPVGDLVGMSKQVNSIAGIRQLAEGLRQLNQPNTNMVYLQLTRFLNSADLRQQASAAQGPVLQQLQAQQVQIYRTSYSPMIDGNLKKLKSQHVPVDDLIEMQDHLSTLNDIERLADGFKKLAASLAPQ